MFSEIKEQGEGKKLKQNLIISPVRSPVNLNEEDKQLVVDVCMNNLKRFNSQQQQQHLQAVKNDKSNKYNRCNGSTTVQKSVLQECHSVSPKLRDDSSDDNGNGVISPAAMNGKDEEDDCMIMNNQTPPTSQNSFTMQNVALAHALAQRKNPDGSFLPSTNSYQQEIMQQFGQFHKNFNSAQFPQGFNWQALWQQQQQQHQHQQQQIAQGLLVEAHNKSPYNHITSPQHYNHPSCNTAVLTNTPMCSPSSSSASVSSHSNRRDSSNHQDWSFEDQFKQLYDLDDDPRRKPFLNDLFNFMQKRGTQVSRIPIMAKNVLDLFHLYNLVVEKGGLVEVINKKIWREITKGLNLPSSITSAAFTLRTQYMKYLYPYECARENLSNDIDLQSAIEGNKREGRRPSYNSQMYPYSPNSNGGLLTSSKFPFHSHNGLGQFASLSMSKYGQGDDHCLQTSPSQQLLAQQHAYHTNAQNAAFLASALESLQNQAKVANVVQQATQQAMRQANQHLPIRKRNADSDYSENDQTFEKKMEFKYSRKSFDQQRQSFDQQYHEARPFMKISLNNQLGKRTDMKNISNSDSMDISVDVNGVNFKGVLSAQLSINGSSSPRSASPTTHNLCL